MTILHAALLALLCGLLTGDVLSTLEFLRYGIPEANPWLAKGFGPDNRYALPVLVFTHLFAAACGLFLALQPIGSDTAVLVALCAFFAAVVWHNLRAIDDAKRLGVPRK